MSIPVVKLTDFYKDQEKFVQTVGDALVDIGFFAITDHNIEQDLIKEAYKETETFFSQPTQEKEKYIIENNHGQRGFTGFGVEHAKNNPNPDLKEFWHVGREFEKTQPLYNEYPKNIWPNEPFKNTMLSLYEKLDDLSLIILEACGIYLEEDRNFLKGIAENGNTILRLIHYPPVDESMPAQSIRAAAHEDINLITLLCESTASGLELLEKDGSWRKIDSIPGQIVVDAGDMLQNLTNGFFKSTTHRVVNPDSSKERRFSMPYFVHARSEVDLSPHKSCIEKTGGKQRYENISAGDFLSQRLAEIGLQK